MLLGIDLGTTNSVAAVFRDGRTELIPNALGHEVTPSAVGIGDDGTVLVGLAARERIATHPHLTAIGFKRWMGTDKTVRLGSRSFRAEELSALLLKSIKADVESRLDAPVHEAVVTVPAYFNQAQRKATQVAAELAGLRVDRLLNEPTAAGLAYGLQDRPEHSTFLVFDLGGGTFDVSVLEYFDGIVQVRSSAGDTRLGGEDFARALGQGFVARQTDLAPSAREALLQSGALWHAAEQAKRDLSETTSTRMRLRHAGRELVGDITREDFEQACASLIARLRQPIERALMDARIQVADLSEVVLVGGATRMPIIRQTVARLFQRLPLRTINPDETIARGAAIQAGLMARDAALEDVVLTDVMPFSLGVVIQGDRFSPIIERNMPVPVSRVSRYCTVSDRQTAIHLEVRQGESPVGSDNLLLGAVELTVPPLPAGQAEVDVRLSYDANGLLVVDAHDTRGGKAVNTVIRQQGDSMSEADVAAALKRLEALKVHPRDQQENRYLIERAKRLYEDRLGEQRAMLGQWLSAFEAVLATQDPQAIARARAQLREALDSVDGSFVW
jgi:molecular chaperone HscC